LSKNENILVLSTLFSTQIQNIVPHKLLWKKLTIISVKTSTEIYLKSVDDLACTVGLSASASLRKRKKRCFKELDIYGLYFPLSVLYA